MSDEVFDRLSLLLGLIEIAVKHLLEGPLRPLIVNGVAGAHLTVPVEAEAYLVELLTVAVDILHRRHLGVLARLYGILLGGQAIGIVAHRVEHVIALQTLEAGVDVAGDISQRMAHMEARTAGVREHVEDVELLFALVLGYFIGLVGLPIVEPFLLYFLKIIFHWSL